MLCRLTENTCAGYEFLHHFFTSMLDKIYPDFSCLDELCTCGNSSVVLQTGDDVAVVFKFQYVYLVQLKINVVPFTKAFNGQRISLKHLDTRC